MSCRFLAETGPTLAEDPAWDALLLDTGAPSVFLTSTWLAAWQRTLAAPQPAFVVRAFAGTRLVAAGAFQPRGRALHLAGHGASDYADILIAPDLDDAGALAALEAVLDTACRAQPTARRVVLQRLRDGSRALALLPHSRLFAGARPEAVAPWLRMSAAPATLGKKRLRREARNLARRGEVGCDTFTRAEDVLPRLEAFFELHRKRWHGTDTAGTFHDPAKRAFYREVTPALAALGALRYTELTLDGRLVAAHFGFSWGGTFTCYKPCFDPGCTPLSPGTVLTMRLIEQAQREQVGQFDFTIGDEAYKQRFATDFPRVTTARAAPSRLHAGLLRLRAGARRALTPTPAAAS